MLLVVKMRVCYAGHVESVERAVAQQLHHIVLVVSSVRQGQYRGMRGKILTVVVCALDEPLPPNPDYPMPFSHCSNQLPVFLQAKYVGAFGVLSLELT